MSDMPTDFWAGWIVVVTITSFVGLGWLIFSVYFSAANEREDLDEPVWDGNLREGSNPAPMWWFWLILTMMVFSVIYLMLYPGLGSFSGALKWTQGGHLAASISRYELEFRGTRNLIAEANLETIQADESLMMSAQRIFDRNCAVCHGYEARGLAGHFPNLTDAEWQWGGTPEQIEQSIRGGRKAVMVGWSGVLGDDGVHNVADFISKLGSGEETNGLPGQAQYMQFCVACHAADGSGTAILGAPSLVDEVWLYGNTEAELNYTIANGRRGEMPAFVRRLDDTQIRLLVALLTR